MKKISSSLIVIMFFLSVSGQEKTASVGAPTLEAAVDYSLAHSPSVAVRRLKERQAEYKLSEIKLDYLPDVYATTDLRRNIVIPSTPIPASMLNPSAAEGELMYMRFNTPWTSGTGLNLAFDIFNPETFGRKAEQEKQVQISRFDSQMAENELRANVSQAYVDCAIAQTQFDALVADTAYYATLLREAEGLYARGKISLADRNNTEMNRNASLVRLHQAEEILSVRK